MRPSHLFKKRTILAVIDAIISLQWHPPISNSTNASKAESHVPEIRHNRWCGAGFIGSNLAGARSQPEKRGSAAVIDDLSTGKAENLSGADARPLVQVPGSIADLELLRSAL